MKFINSEIRWAGRTYRAPAGDGDGDGDGGGGGEGDGDGGGGDGDGGGDGGGDGDGGGGDGDGDGDGDGGKGDGDPDWRERYTGYQAEGEDYSKLLGRFTDEEAFVKGAVQAHEKLRAGEVATGLPEDPTDEQLASYREANGIPVDGKYDLTSSVRELTDMDVEMLGPVAEIAHKHNISQDALVELMDSYMGETDKIVDQMHTQDNLDAAEFTKVAKENWGGEYTINMNRANNQLNLLPEAIRDQVKQAKMPNGMGIMNSPEFMTWLVNVDRTITPLDPIKGGAEATLNDARSIVAKAKERMRDDSIGWHKDKKGQQEYMQAQTMIDQFEGSQ